MLRQVYILKEGIILYEKNFSKALTLENFQNIYQEIVRESFHGLRSDFGSYDFFRYKIIYTSESELKLTFIFITSFTEDFDRVKRELRKFKNEFIDLFGDNIDNLDPTLIKMLDPFIESIHRNIKTKISLVGFSGVGKTTITKLIREEEIPSQHIPTITGKVSTIKIGKLNFHLWDFAGQEQFSYLWNNFILGSDAVLLITNSTLRNIEKSKFFLELIKDHAPYAQCAVIGNKQDLPDALNVEDIERILGLKTYSMIAIDSGNRDKMIQIIADILEINVEVSLLLKPLFERDRLINIAKKTLENGDLAQAVEYFEKISDMCLELGDDALYKEFYERAKKFKSYLTHE